jgi:nicotine blue oxidoreductase
VELGGETLAQRGVAMLQDGGADPVILVTGAVPVMIPEALAVHNPDWSTGMGSSLATGLRALTETDVAAAVIALADQPLVGPGSVRRLIGAYRDGAPVAVAAYDGEPRNPVLIAREYWPVVLQMATGDTGARAFLQAYAELVTQVECGDTGSPDDIDTAEDLARVRGVATVRSEEKS